MPFVDSTSKLELIEGINTLTETTRGEMIDQINENTATSMLTGSYITVLEKAPWQLDSNEKVASSLSIYQVDNGEITQVWYFPSMQTV